MIETKAELLVPPKEPIGVTLTVRYAVAKTLFDLSGSFIGHTTARDHMSEIYDALDMVGVDYPANRVKINGSRNANISGGDL